MGVEYYETEDEFYASLPEEKREAVKAFWESKTPEEIGRAKKTFLAITHEQDIKQAVCDSDTAVALLEVAAGYLERREQMPFHLADFIAKAFRAAATANESDSLSVTEARRNALAAGLNITAPGKRPKADTQQVGDCIFRVMTGRAQDKSPITETAAAKQVSLTLGISHRAAKDHWKKWKKTNPDRYDLLLKVLQAFKVGG